MSDQGFSDQINKTLAFEGGYGNDPADPGGETNFGISKRQYPDLDIRGMTREKAIWIYFNDYWKPYRLAELPPAIGGKIFDLGVNMGSVTAIRLLQRALGADPAGGRFRVDGKIGPLTIAATKTADQASLMNRIRQLAADRYDQIIAQNPTRERFRHGWMRRAWA